MQISGETARYELTHLNLHCLQKAQYCLGAERVNVNRIGMGFKIINSFMYEHMETNVKYKINTEYVESN